MNVLNQIKEGKSNFAVLVDPDKSNKDSLKQIAELSEQYGVDIIFVGGSILMNPIDETILTLKKYCNIPVFIFPGNVLQLSSHADGILFISLISGRNPEFLIGHHVLAAPSLMNSNLEVIPTGYILIENGKLTSVEYMSNTKPVPADKSEIAVATAQAGELLGLKAIYLEAGSGATNIVSTEMIRKIKSSIHIPLIVGGGIQNSDDLGRIYEAGADLIVVGTAVEKNPELIIDLLKK